MWKKIATRLLCLALRAGKKAQEKIKLSQAYFSACGGEYCHECHVFVGAEPLFGDTRTGIAAWGCGSYMADKKSYPVE